MTKSVAFVLWALIFLTGLGVLLWRQTLEIHAIAAKQMPVNHLIWPADLRGKPPGDDFVGRYTRSNMVLGQIIRPEDVSSTPLLASRSRPFFAVLVQRDLVSNGSVDVATTGKVCNKEQAIGDAEVVAAFCNRLRGDPSCMALVAAEVEVGPKLKANESTFWPACPTQK
jgi:hypothetical protein